jgi:dTDP-4-amino-4,6-dideoxygalactose transaminase
VVTGGRFSKLCEEYLAKETGSARALLVPSCTAALEMSVMLSGVGPGDEVILPSFTFSSCANAVILRGGTPVFVDSRMDTLNIDETKIEELIGAKTEAIMAVHYAGVAADMDSIGRIARDYQLFVIEDGAQAIGNLRLTGEFGGISFNTVKNIECGEGGVLLLRDQEFVERAETIRDCGTTREKFKRGDINDWDWVDIGSQYLMTEMTAEVLWRNLQRIKEITEGRKVIWRIYAGEIKAEHKSTQIGNGHCFWVMVEKRDEAIVWLKEKGITAKSHYTPLHSRPPGMKYGRAGTIVNAGYISEHLLRLPLNVYDHEAYAIAAEVNKLCKQEKEYRSGKTNWSI